MGRTAAEIISAVQPTQPSRPPLVWTRRATSDNIIVMTDEAILVDSLPPNALPESCEQLESGTPPARVLTSRVLPLRFLAVQAVHARLGTTQVEVVYDSGGRRMMTRKLLLRDEEAQTDFLHAVRDRLPDRVEVVESCGSRTFHALTPLHVLIALPVLAAFAQAFFTLEAEDPQQTRQYVLEAGSYGGATANVVGLMDRVRRILGPIVGGGHLGSLVMIGAAAVAGILTMIGHTAAMVILLGGAAGALAWTVMRFANPPRTLSVVAARAR